jgi:hypothetical protein
MLAAQEAEMKNIALVALAFLQFALVSFAFADEIGTQQATLEQEYDALYALIVAEGFKPSVRYTEGEMAKMYERGERDPFWCGPLAEHITQIAQVSEKRWGAESRLFRMWRRHEADYLATNHICEDGHPFPRPTKAYEIYLELGLVQDARRAAFLHADIDLYAAAYGMDFYRPWLDIDEPTRVAFLMEGIEWLGKADKDERYVRTLLGDWGRSLESEGYNLSAARFFFAADGNESVDTIRALIKSVRNPVPSCEKLGADFVRALGASEAHP